MRRFINWLSSWYETRAIMRDKQTVAAIMQIEQGKPWEQVKKDLGW